MTIRGALSDLDNLLKADDIPFYYKPSIKAVIDTIALEQEPRKGHWIETAEEYYKAINEKGGGVNENTDFFTDDIACSECLAKFSVIDNEAERFDFCPCCGSDNREVVEE